MEENKENKTIPADAITPAIVDKKEKPAAIITSEDPGVHDINNRAGFEHIQRVGMALAQSDIIPANYKGKAANCIVAIEIAIRLKCSPLMVMQNLHIINNRPVFSSQLLIATINSSSEFKGRLKFKYEGEGKTRECFAYINDKSGDLLEGPSVSIKMAEDEGWMGKTGSKWKTMPEIMLAYRAASFFAKIYAPHLTMGMDNESEYEEAVVIEDSETLQEINQ